MRPEEQFRERVSDPVSLKVEHESQRGHVKDLFVKTRIELRDRGDGSVMVFLGSECLENDVCIDEDGNVAEGEVTLGVSYRRSPGAIFAK
jgi:hypothetical protein